MSRELVDQKAKMQALLEEMSPEEQEEAVFLVEKLRRASESRVGFLAHVLGLRWRSLGRGHMRCELAVNRKLFNPQGVLHGGVIFTMVDYSMGAATIGLLDDAKGERCATIELKINYLAAVTGGNLVADTKVVSEGSRVVVLESRVTGENGRLVALATGSYYIIRQR